MPFALELARRINALRFENLPAEAVHWAKVDSSGRKTLRFIPPVPSGLMLA